jgi:two-component system, LytTR family, response regulator
MILNRTAYDSVLYFEAQQNYTTAIGGGKNTLFAYTIKKFEEMLSSNNFVRIHKSFLVNRAFIKEVIDGPKQTVVMQDGRHLMASRRKKICPISLNYLK